MGLIKEWREWRDYRRIQEFRESGMDELLLQAGLTSAVLTKEEALSIPSVGTCVDLISDIIATLPIKLHKETSGKVEEVEEDRRIILLNDETYDTLDGFQFKKALVKGYLSYSGKMESLENTDVAIISEVDFNNAFDAHIEAENRKAELSNHPEVYERLAELEKENKDLKLALAESAEAQQQDKIENQLAIAELAELIATKGDL
ncbi:hypothetical protein [Lysinibacillus xylanilyticus]|uniref:hypothetical protein n=1 Tax=Lysinibacillus xylanilyticus TaxID=582475 RepID=UPI003D03BAD7